jgi:hypothetical protein
MYTLDYQFLFRMIAGFACGKLASGEVEVLPG